MAVALDPLSDLQHQLELAATDPQLDPADRVAKLRALRDRIADLVAIADRFLNDSEKLREAEASQAARARMRVRDIAELREEMLDRGVPAEALDEAGVVGHRFLDELEEERLLEVVAPLIRHPLNPAEFDTRLHPHGMHGRFEQTPDKIKPGKDAKGAEGVPPVDERYKDYFEHDPEAIVAHVDRLSPTKDVSPEKLARARRNLDRAKAGKMAKRAPLDVAEKGDGTLAVLDGNATHAALAKEGLTHMPAKIDHGVESIDDEAISRAADEIATKAEKAERDITPGLKHIVAENGGTMTGLDQRLKSRASIVSKIRRKQEKHPGMPANKAAEKILDSVRYTAVYPSGNYLEGVKKVEAAMAAKGYTQAETKNFWGGQDDYDAYHVIFRSPTGVAVELQFHTPESSQTKSKLHPLFESFRGSKNSTERYELWHSMIALTAETPVPPGVDVLGPTVATPSAKQRARRQEDSPAAGAQR